MANPNISLLGATYSGVTGVTLPKSGGGTATFPWVEGSQTITTNNTYDVTNLASVTVNVSGGGGGNEFIVTLTYNSSTAKWEPNKTYAEIMAANTAGKTIAVNTDSPSMDVTADGEVDGSTFTYWVREYYNDDADCQREQSYIERFNS